MTPTEPTTDIETIATPSWITLDRAQFAQNIGVVRQHIGPRVKLMVAVKANAYGHGSRQIARICESNGVDWLAVASVSEAAVVRDAGVRLPILVLTALDVSQVALAQQLDLTAVVFDMEQGRSLADEAHRIGWQIPCHVKIDSGMSRLGLQQDEVLSSVTVLQALPGLRIEGLMTHFAVADEDENWTQQQLTRFMECVDILRSQGIAPALLHAGNSPAMLRDSRYHLDMVRPGLAMYGFAPSESVSLWPGMAPVLTWKTRISQVRTLAAGQYVGYGNQYRTSQTEQIAILPVGYADGFRRAPAGWQHVLIGGQAAPVVGRISMEKCAVRVDHIDPVQAGDEAVLIGRQGDATLTADQVAEWLGTIHYEVVTCLNDRIRRLVI